MKRKPKNLKSAFRAAKKRERRKIWSAEKARLRRGGRLGKQFFVRGKVVTIRFAAPRTLSCSDVNVRAATLDFFARLRDHSRRKNVQIVLDFSNVEAVFPSGAVLLVAEIDRALACTSTLIQGKRSRTPLVDEVLQQIGVYEKTGVICSTAPHSESVIHWRVASGVMAEGELGGSILENYEGRLAEGLTRGIYDGVVEAMTNTVQHAYADEVPGGIDLRRLIGKRWWMLSQERDGILTVAICDLGVGIPQSLPRSKTFGSATLREFWRNSRLDRSDGSAISVALQLGRTRTGLKQRGKGLADIVDAVNLSKDGGVIIYSNRGIFSSNEGVERIHNHSHSVHGTMVYWYVSINDDSSPDG